VRLSTPGHSARLSSLCSKQATGSVIFGHGDWSLGIFFFRGKKGEGGGCNGLLLFFWRPSTGLTKAIPLDGSIDFARLWDFLGHGRNVWYKQCELNVASNDWLVLHMNSNINVDSARKHISFRARTIVEPIVGYKQLPHHL
jgi:hypothetical protein